VADSARQEDFLFAEHVLRKGFSTEEQVAECLALLERLRGEMQLEETLRNLLLKKGYLAPAQAHVIDQAINPAQAGAAKNQIEGYQLLSRLGAGAMGSVYKALHLKLNIPVALKVLRVDLAKSRTQIERLKREAQLAARLNHPNIVRSIDVGESNGFHYFAMEFVDGQTVRQILRKGRLKEREALSLLRDVARALEHAHGQGVIHRDVKPGNIMLSADGTVKLADLGLARGQEPSDLTLEHASIGTPQYVAPEQVRSGANATERSDLFSLGATLYQLVTGRPPFSGDSLGEIIRKVLALEFDPPESVVPDLSIDTVYLIHRLMRANPRERYASAAELLGDLDRIAKGIRVAPAGFKGDYESFVARRRARRVALGVGAGTVLAVSLLFTWNTLRERRERDRHAALCAEVDGRGARGVAEAETLDALRSELDGMERAMRESGCEAERTPELALRVESARVGVAALGEGERLLEAAGRADADFRALEAARRRLEPRLPGARKRLAEIGARIESLSREDAQARYKAAYVGLGFADGPATLRGLELLAKDLEARYLPIGEAWAAQPRHDFDTLRRLDEAMANADAAYGPRIKAALDVDNFSNAATQNELRVNKRNEARSLAHERRAHAAFLVHWPSTDRRETDLSEEEQQHWNQLAALARARAQAGRPDEAETKLNEFRSSAHRTKGQLSDLLATVVEQKKALLATQLRELTIIEGHFRAALQERLYERAALIVNQDVAGRAADLWILEAGTRAKQLVARGEAVRALVDRLLAGARALPSVAWTVPGEKAPLVQPGSALERDPGGEPDRFLLRTPKAAYPLALRDLPHDTLARIMSFDPSRLADVSQSGYFYAAEGYRELRADRYKADELWGKALVNLSRAGDAWAEDVRADKRALVEEIDRATQLAARLFDEAKDAHDRKDHLSELSLLKRLKAIGWTRSVEPQLPLIDRKIADLELLTGFDLRRRESGIPPQQFEYDPGTGRVLLRYTGSLWHPLGDKVPEGVDAEAWLLDRERDYWYQEFKGAGADAKDWPILYERARYQLLDWDPATIEAAPGGGYRLRVARIHENLYRWLGAEKYPGAPLVASLRNDLHPRRDWSIECTASWEDSAPGVFTLAAGRMQATVGYWPREYGGGAGCALFEDENAVDGYVPHFSDFHWKADEAERKKRKKIPAPSHRAYLDGFQGGAPYRIRMEREMDRIRVRLAPLAEWEKSGFPKEPLLERKMTSKEIERATRYPVDAPAFRFYCHVRFTLRNVIVGGHLKGPE